MFQLLLQAAGGDVVTGDNQLLALGPVPVLILVQCHVLHIGHIDEEARERSAGHRFKRNLHVTATYTNIQLNIVKLQ